MMGAKAGDIWDAIANIDKALDISILSLIVSLKIALLTTGQPPAAIPVKNLNNANVENDSARNVKKFAIAAVPIENNIIGIRPCLSERGPYIN